MLENENIKLIPLTQEQFAIVDNEDFGELSKFKWYAHKTSYGGYRAVRMTPRPNHRTILMHWQIMNTPKGMEVDHVNHNTLDNRKTNLRICTRAENQHNRRLQKGTSKYKGVYWNKRDKKWVAQIKLEGKQIYLGYFDSEIEAAKCYDINAIKYFGEFAKLNFPRKEYE